MAISGCSPHPVVNPGNESARIGQDKPMDHGAMANSPSERMHAAMTKPMRSKVTGDVDRDFAAMMAEHHAWAIEMAKIELEYGKNAELRKMAQNVIKAQSAEIEVLNKHAKMSH